MENKMKMKELNLNEMSDVVGGSNVGIPDAYKKVAKIVYDLYKDIYKKLFG